MPPRDTSLAWASDTPSGKERGTVASLLFADDHETKICQPVKLERTLEKQVSWVARFGNPASNSPMAWLTVEDYEPELKPSVICGVIGYKSYPMAQPVALDPAGALHHALRGFYSIANVTDVFVRRDSNFLRVYVCLLDGSLPDKLLEALVRIEAKILSPETGLYLDFQYLPKADVAEFSLGSAVAFQRIG